MDLRSRTISVVAGNRTKNHSNDKNPAKATQLNTPHKMRFDNKNNLYVAKRNNHVIQHINMKTNVIKTLSKTKVTKYNDDNNPTTMTQLNQPHNIVLDRSDNVFIYDINNHRVR